MDFSRSLKEEFEAFFSNLAVGRNPTPLKNTYQILDLDFSGIETGSREQIEEGFNRRTETALKTFLRRYGYDPATERIIEEQNSPAGKIDYFFNLIGEAKIYLLIDEYDHFANAILGESLELFSEIVGKGGFVRAFYEVIKTATGRGIVDRLLITGVTSITLDSMTSGFNIGKNLSFAKECNQIMGFTGQETEEMIRPLIDICGLNAQKMMEDLAQWYNGYQFSSRAHEKVFNPDMVLYFIDSFDRETCRYPEQMLDNNIASDYGKIMRLFGIGDRESNFGILSKIQGSQKKKFKACNVVQFIRIYVS